MALPSDPNQLASILKSVQPVAKDQFAGSDYPGSYLWAKGNLGPEQFHAQKAAHNDMPKMPHIVPIAIHSGGIKTHGR